MSTENAVFLSLEIIESKITEKLTVENIASNVYFSKYHYQRLFRDIVGDSVMDYVTKRKLTLAGRALLETNSSILDIALQFGYNSHEGFTRAFKGYMGVTPKEYRKYVLTAISQNKIKGRFFMTYSKNTDEIIRELNEFIAKARETAELTKKGTILEYNPFWDVISRNTNSFTDRLQKTLERITDISQHPDAITNRFAIIKIIEDVSFESNLLAFNVNLVVSRGKPEHIELQKPLCEQFTKLAFAATIKTNKITALFNELSGLIFEDMHKNAELKIKTLVSKTKAVADSIQGYSYIKQEVISVADGLSSLPTESLTVNALEDFLFRINILSFAADIDVCRMPTDKPLFDSFSDLKDCFWETIEFWRTLVKPELKDGLDITTKKNLGDISFQGNILLFYTRGEVSDEKLGRFLSDEQKNAFLNICNKINDFIAFAQKSNDKSAYKTIADMLSEIISDLSFEAHKLGEKSGAVRFIMKEFNFLQQRVLSCDIKE